MALEFINRNNNILPDYEITMIVQDTQCKSDVVMKQFMHFLLNNSHPVAAILGEYNKIPCQKLSQIFINLPVYIPLYISETWTIQHVFAQKVSMSISYLLFWVFVGFNDVILR